MKIETKLTLNNIRKNPKRTIFTFISIILCTFLIFTVMLIISSIRNGIDESLISDGNDYYFAIKNLSIDDFNKIKNKEYIDTIYIQNEDKGQLYKLEDKNIIFFKADNINVYLKFTNINRTCRYCNDIISTLNFTYDDVIENCEINEELLNVHGLMNISILTIFGEDVAIRAGLNLSYVIDVMILLILIVFSILFIIILYNAFLITINERRQEYAILNSIGATKYQITTMIFKETTIIGAIGIIIGVFLSIIAANIILNVINNILINTIYSFKISIKIQYAILLILVVILNIYISAIIPSIEASNTSVIQKIRNNKHIKNKKKQSILEKIFSVEGRIALKNLKRNKSKYRIITILLVVCMTSYIITETYIKYETKASDIATPYDVDAEFEIDSNKNFDYKTILENYSKETGDSLKYIKYKSMYLYFLIEPQEAILYKDKYTLDDGMILEDGNVRTGMLIIGLEEKEYNNYIKKLNANYEDYILYNNNSYSIENEADDSLMYEFNQIFDENYNNLEFNIINIIYSDIYNLINNEIETILKYEIICKDVLPGNIFYTDNYLKWFKEHSYNGSVIMYVDMNTYDKIENQIQDYILLNKENLTPFFEMIESSGETTYIKVKCGNILSFSKYMDNVMKSQNIDLEIRYYTLENQENIIYVNILEFLLKLIIGTIVVIGIASSINILNASLNERKKEFETLNVIGATKKNINKILIHECIFIFIKALIISLIISIPVIYKIVEYMKNIIVLEKLLIPYINIAIFILALFIISLLVTLYSSKSIKNYNIH